MGVSLDAALTGLRVAQQALDMTSVNISNASTEGYTRKILPQESLIIAGKSVGAKSGAVFRNVDTGLITAQQDQTSLTGYYSVISTYNSRIMDFHGASESGLSISAKIGELSNSFTTLSAAPDNLDYLTRTISEAQQVASSFNDFSNLINSLRQKTENDITAAVNDVNQQLENIANLNQQITRLFNAGRSVADLEDQRDIAVNQVSQYLDINTYQENQNLVVITKQGVSLADTDAHPLFFGGSSVSSSKYYPGGGLNGLRIESDTGTDITDTNLGGEIGALFELRDTTLPKYEAQLDEMAQKLAYRFQQAGLTLFTNSTGNVPANATSPDPVTYVGYARQLVVNQQVINDPHLLRHGTTGNTEQDGSTEVIRRITEFALGDYEYQEARGNVDISAGALVATLGMVTNNRVTGTVNIAGISPDFSAIPNAASLPGDFDITLGGVGTQTIAVTAADDADSLVTKINTAFGTTVASLNNSGQLALNHDGTITLADNVAQPIGAAAFTDLGMAFAVTAAPAPAFEIYAGTKIPTTITIAAADTSVELLAKLNAVSGISATLTGGGELLITPINGGDITITNVEGSPVQDLGVSVNSIAHVGMRNDYLGPNNDIETDLISNSGIIDYAISIVSSQGEATRITENRLEQETAFLQTLEKRNANASGVNIDEEMASLIRLQTAYSAAAKMISTSNELFEKLLQNM